jgi:hypothetical protein
VQHANFDAFLRLPPRILPKVEIARKFRRFALLSVSKAGFLVRVVRLLDYIFCQ